MCYSNWSCPGLRNKCTCEYLVELFQECFDDLEVFLEYLLIDDVTLAICLLAKDGHSCCEIRV